MSTAWDGMMRGMNTKSAIIALAAGLAACANNQADNRPPAPASPPSAATAQQAITASPRHGEWVMIKTGANDSVRAWVVYPERKTKAPVVVVIHEIYGVSNWIRSVADQLAADGFIAIAPDLLTKFNLPNNANGEPIADSAVVRIRQIAPQQYQPQIRAVAEWGMNLPAATRKYGVVGYCWGGGAVFAHAAYYPDVNALVSYYGPTPDRTDLERVKAPVLGLYGENDERVNSTIGRAQAAAHANGFTYEVHKFAGAGHGFLRQQDGQNGANLKATQEAWPMTVVWFRKYLGEIGG